MDTGPDGPAPGDLDERSADFLIRQALMHRARKQLAEALRAVETLLEYNPSHAEALSLKDAIQREHAVQQWERKEAERARALLAAGICRAISIGLVIVAWLLWGVAFDDTMETHLLPPMVFGVRRVYWYLLGAVVMVILAFVVWLQRYRWVPDWTDLDQPDPKGRYGYRWWW